MKTSESIVEISKALSKAWGELTNPKHNKTVSVRTKSGATYTFDYADLGGILDTIKPHYKEHGITIVQQPYTEMGELGNFICIDTMLLHESGEWIKSKPLKVPISNNIQDMGGQITYLKRYSLSAMLGISTEQDDDENAASGNEFEFKNKPTKEVSKAVILAKFQTGGGTKEQFHEWYAKQMSSGYSNNQMDAYLTKKLVDKK